MRTGRPPVLIPAAIELGMDAKVLLWTARSALADRDQERAAQQLEAALTALDRQARALSRLERRPAPK